MTSIPRSEPATVTAGDTVQWLRQLADYPASDGWTLTYTLINGAAKITINSTPDGDAHLVAATAATSATWEAGSYDWQARATRGSGPSLEAATVAMGRMQVRPAFGAATTLDARTTARQALDAVEAYMANGSNLQAASYTIGGRSLSRHSFTELLALRSRLRADVAREEALATGIDSRRVYVRFGRH
jgi:hypothetical protein